MRESRPWRAAALWLAGLGPFFFLSYGFANWATTLRGHVPSIVFGWEHRIPFLAWTIVPYWSTDLFYAMSFFLCRTCRELNVHGKRLLAAQTISVVLFLMFPLRFTFAHPRTTGLFGLMFDALRGFDRPFNQAPSLHLSLTVILWAKYSEHMRGLPLFLLRCWFAISGLSILTTYQHHFIDLPTGIWVGLFCVVLFSDSPAAAPHRSQHPGASLGLGAVYFAGAAGLIAAAVRLGGLGWLLLWPAGSLLIVAMAYATGSTQLFCRRDGTMSRASVALLAPYMAVVWLNSRWWTRGQPAVQEIVPGVWLGRAPSRSERDRFRIASIVELAPELLIDREGIAYRGVPMLDLVVPAAHDLEAAVKAIDVLQTDRPTLVCCALGYSRSAMVAAAWLVASRNAPSVDSAIALLRARRRRVILSPAHRARLEEWAQTRGSYAS
jgi:protein-tyrosine phosphatase